LSTITESQRTKYITAVDDFLLTWMEAFLNDRKAQGSALGTLRFYSQKLRLFLNYCQANTVEGIGQINPNFIQNYLLFLEESGHNPSGKHAAFRTLRAFMNWYEAEAEPTGWANPIHKVKAPKVPIEPLEPVPLKTVFQMVHICKQGALIGDRDAAILLCLLDTGVRANELLSIDLDDINQARGTILIRADASRVDSNPMQSPAFALRLQVVNNLSDKISQKQGSPKVPTNTRWMWFVCRFCFVVVRHVQKCQSKATSPATTIVFSLAMDSMMNLLYLLRVTRNNWIIGLYSSLVLSQVQ
jgi:site-specific recombinase XerD